MWHKGISYTEETNQDMPDYGKLCENIIGNAFVFCENYEGACTFLKVGFVGKDTEWIEQAEFFRQQFEELLSQTVQISSGMINRNVIASEELVTPYTLAAERQTRQLSGISIDGGITELELQLQWGACGSTVLCWNAYSG